MQPIDMFARFIGAVVLMLIPFIILDGFLRRKK